MLVIVTQTLIFEVLHMKKNYHDQINISIRVQNTRNITADSIWRRRHSDDCPLREASWLRAAFTSPLRGGGETLTTWMLLARHKLRKVMEPALRANMEANPLWNSW
jgi:hypothetical protein